MKTVRKSELAELVEKSEATLTTWQKNGMPIYKEGTRGQGHQYRVWDVIQWLINRELSKIATDGGSGEHDYETERARLTFHQANKVALEEDLLRGTSILATVVEDFQSRMIMAFRAKCLALPTKTAPRLLYLDNLAAIEREIRDAVYEALTELSEFRYEDYGIRSVSDAGTEDNATAESDSELVG